MANTKNIPIEFQGRCAVAGDSLDTRTAEEKGLVAEYKGEKYYFCCPSCKPAFVANPENYLRDKKKLIKLEFTGKEHIADNVWSFSFTPKSSINWQAGQYLRLLVPHDNPDARGTKRWFTASSAPYEKVITITTRISDSSYKQALAHLKPGDTANVVDLPGGDFIWSENDDTPRVFVIGGIGITPFYSIVKQRLHDKLPLDATLLYANRNEYVAFRDYFDDLQNAGLRTSYITGDALTADIILDASSTPEQTLYYVSGAKPMVEHLASELMARGVMRDKIISDAFTYYNENNY